MTWAPVSGRMGESGGGVIRVGGAERARGTAVPLRTLSARRSQSNPGTEGRWLCRSMCEKAEPLVQVGRLKHRRGLIRIVWRFSRLSFFPCHEPGFCDLFSSLETLSSVGFLFKRHPVIPVLDGRFELSQPFQSKKRARSMASLLSGGLFTPIVSRGFSLRALSRPSVASVTDAGNPLTEEDRSLYVSGSGLWGDHGTSYRTGVGAKANSRVVCLAIEAFRRKGHECWLSCQG